MENKTVTPKEILNKYTQAWFSDGVEMIDETSYVPFPEAIQALEEYAELKLQEYKESLKPKTNTWGAPIGSGSDYTKDAGPRDV